MRDKQSHKGGELARGILLAHLILLLHIGLIALLALVVLFVGGLARHLTWFLIGGIALILASAFLVLRRLKDKRGKVLETINSLPHLRDREVEIRFLGGIMSVRFNPVRGAANELPAGEDYQRPQLEDPARVRNRELLDLAVMLDKNLITREEFNQIKQQFLHPK